LGAAAGAGLGSASSLRALAQDGVAMPLDLAPRKLALHNLHTGESLQAIYWENGRYVPGAIAAANHVLRDFRTGDQHMMDPALLDLVHRLHGKVGAGAPVQVISGYRSPKTNALLHEHSDGVAKQSLHMQGMAMDVRIEGVALDHLHKAALDIGRGGVGYYPSSNFVHVDVGRVRQWQGV
jgi:uncharacterized protein YcbK (DUF882 family)